MSEPNANLVTWQGPELQEEQVSSVAQLDPEAVRQAAYEEGFARGRAEGEKQGQEQLAAAVGSINQLLIAVQEPIRKMEGELAASIVQFAARIAANMVRAELAVNESLLIERILDVANRLPDSEGNICLFVSAADYEVVQHHLDNEEYQDLPHDWQLQHDVDLMPGDCRVQSGNSSIAALLLEEAEDIVHQAEQKEIVSDE